MADSENVALANENYDWEEQALLGGTDRLAKAEDRAADVDVEMRFPRGNSSSRLNLRWTTSQRGDHQI